MTSASTDRRLGLTGSRAIKTPCKAATTSNITLSGEQTVDGVSCVTGDRVLVKSQTSSVDNGIYVVDTGTWTRDLDFDGPADVTTGTIVMVLNGSANVNTYWRLTTTGTATFGSSAITFASALASDASLLAFVPSGAGATTISVQDELREWVRPEQYGATGLGLVDDSAAVQAAINTGKQLEFTQGATYLCNTKLTKTATRFSWRGNGAILKKTNTGTLLEIGAANSGSRRDTFEFGDLQFLCGGSTGGQTIAIDVINSTASQQNITFRGVSIYNFINGASAKPTNSAIVQADYSKAWYKNFLYADFLSQSDTAQINPSSQSIGIRFGGNVWSCRLQNCWIEGCNIGIHSSGGNNDYLKVKDTTIISCAAAFIGDRTTNVSFVDCTIEFNYSGIWVWGAKHISLRDSQLEGNELHHVFLGGDATLARCQCLLMENVNLQPLSGDRLNQVNALYMPACDTAFIRNVSFNGSTTVQTAEKGYDVFCGTETYRVVLEAPFEASDGFIQVNDTTKLSAAWRKTSASARYQFYDKGFLNLPKQIGTVEGDVGYDTTNHWPTFYDGTSTATIAKNFVKVEGATTDALSTSGPTVFWTNPSGKTFYPIAYGVKVIAKTGTAGTGMVFDIERSDTSTIVRLQSVTLSINAGVGDMQQGSMIADLVHPILSGQTWAFKITTAASGGTISVLTVKPFVVGFLE